MSLDNEQKAIIRHANKLVRYDIAKLSTVAQNLMAFLFSIWTKEPNEQTILDFQLVKERLGLAHENDSYLQQVIAKTGKEIVNKSFINAQFEDGLVIGYLIYQFRLNLKTQQLEVFTTSNFMNLFRMLKDGYTEYDFLQFYKIESKQGKNIYYLCRKYFKGQFTMDWADFRKELGYKESANNRNIMMYVKKAIDYLVSHHYLKSCEIIPIYKMGRGRPLDKIRLEYTFPTKDDGITIEEQPEEQSTEVVNTEEVKQPDNLIEESVVPEQVSSPSPEQEPEPEPEPFPSFDLSGVKPASTEEVHLPKIEDVLSAQSQPVKSSTAPAKLELEDELKRLELQCPTCGKPMVIRENRSNHALFWACPDRWANKCSQKTITLPDEVAEIYWKHHK